MPTNTQILLDHRPTDKVSPANFRIIETPVPTPGPGEVLVRHTFLSLDPYMRGRLSDAKSYAKPQEVGAVMGGGTVGIVEASNNPRFRVDGAVVGMGGWQRYELSDGAMLRAVDAKSVPIQAYLGALGMPGVTAWYGLNRIIAPEERDGVGLRRDWRGRLGGRPTRQARRRQGRRDRRGQREMRLCGERARLFRLRRPQVGRFRR